MRFTSISMSLCAINRHEALLAFCSKPAKRVLRGACCEPQVFKDAKLKMRMRENTKPNAKFKMRIRENTKPMAKTME